MTERTLVGILVREVAAEHVPGIKQNLAGMGWEPEWWEWEYHPAEHYLRAIGKVELVDPRDPQAEVEWMARHVWDVTEEYCDVYLQFNPRERDERTYVADEDTYEEYLATNREL